MTLPRSASFAKIFSGGFPSLEGLPFRILEEPVGLMQGHEGQTLLQSKVRLAQVRAHDEGGVVFVEEDREVFL